MFRYGVNGNSETTYIPWEFFFAMQFLKFLPAAF